MVKSQVLLEEKRAQHIEKEVQARLVREKMTDDGWRPVAFRQDGQHNDLCYIVDEGTWNAIDRHDDRDRAPVDLSAFPQVKVGRHYDMRWQGETHLKCSAVYTDDDGFMLTDGKRKYLISYETELRPRKTPRRT